MLSIFPIQIVIAFLLFAGFHHTHERWVAEFQEASQGFHTFLALFVSASKLLGIGFLIYYGISVVWYAPICLFVLAFILPPLLFGLLDAVVGEWSLRIIGFAAVPLCAYFLFSGLPN